MSSPSLFCIRKFVINNSCPWEIIPLHLNHNGVCIDMFVHIILVSELLCLCMLYNIIVGYTSSWYFILYCSREWVNPPLRHCYLYVCINISVNVISMVNAICLCTSYYMLLGCDPYWEYFNTYFLYIICCSIVTTFFDLHSK